MRHLSCSSLIFSRPLGAVPKEAARAPSTFMLGDSEWLSTFSETGYRIAECFDNLSVPLNPHTNSLLHMLIETKLSPSIGSRIENINVRRLEQEDVAEVRAVFLARGVLIFPGQNLVGKEVANFARLFGEPWRSKILTGLPEAPEVVKLFNFGKDSNLTEYWHYDSTYSARPPAITILSALILPPCGGDTMWCNQYAVFEQLSPAMQKMLSGLKAVHYDRQRHKQHQDRLSTDEHTAHPVVRTHPETGRKALFISGQAEHFEGMTHDESRPLLQYLLQLLGQPDVSYRHRWTAGDLLMWDNRCTSHYAIHDYADSERIMHRVTLLGDVPVQ